MFTNKNIKSLYNWESENYKEFYNWFSLKYENCVLSFFSRDNKPERTNPPKFATGNSINIAENVFFDFLPFEMQKGVLELYFEEQNIHILISKESVKSFFS